MPEKKCKTDTLLVPTCRMVLFNNTRI